MFYEIYEGFYTIVYADNVYSMQNWKIYSEENNIIISKEKSSLYKLLKVEEKENENCFYIQDNKTKKYLYLNNEKRDSGSFFIGLSVGINKEDKERFIFYYS